MSWATTTKSRKDFFFLRFHDCSDSITARPHIPHHESYDIMHNGVFYFPGHGLSFPHTSPLNPAIPSQEDTPEPVKKPRHPYFAPRKQNQRKRKREKSIHTHRLIRYPTNILRINATHVFLSSSPPLPPHINTNTYIYAPAPAPAPTPTPNQSPRPKNPPPHPQNPGSQASAQPRLTAHPSPSKILAGKSCPRRGRGRCIGILYQLYDLRWTLTLTLTLTWTLTCRCWRWRYACQVSG